MEQEFLGSGMKFPPQVNPATGRFMVASGTEGIRESVYLILMTQKAERFVRPDFGSGLMSFTFMDTNPTMLNIMASSIRTDILSQEPRVSEVEVEVGAEDKKGCLIVDIRYTVRATNTRDNLVFPFYLDASADEEVETETMI